MAERDELRRERKRERERERRLENCDGKRSKMTRDAGDGVIASVTATAHRHLHHLTSTHPPPPSSAERDVSERIALVQAVPNSTERSTTSGRSTSRGDRQRVHRAGRRVQHLRQGAFRGGAAAESQYRPTRGAQEDEWAVEEKAAENVLKAARFKAGDRGFEGSREQGENQRAQGAPVEFEADADEADPFGLDQFLSEAKRGKALDKIGEGSGMAAAAGGASGTGDSNRSIGFARGKP